jgi:hypothetical protein
MRLYADATGCTGQDGAVITPDPAGRDAYDRECRILLAMPDHRPALDAGF